MRFFRSVHKRWLWLTRPTHVRRHIFEYNRWLADAGEELRYDFPNLRSGAVAVDLGGHQGEWAEGIANRYNARVHVFEPHPRFAAEMSRRLKNNANIMIHPVALASKAGTFNITDDGVASRASEHGTIECHSVEAKSYLERMGITTIDLLKINIEGGEYDILAQFIETGMISSIDTIQVQYHRNHRDDERRRTITNKNLSKTHHQTWCYEFIWEEWKITSSQ